MSSIEIFYQAMGPTGLSGPLEGFNSALRRREAMNIQAPPPPGGNGVGRHSGKGPGGKARRAPKGTPKGRQIDLKALDEVRALLGERERRRDLLIEHLHLIQDRYGHLSAAHLAALAAEMKL